nr:transposase [Actinomycetes bacterium]
MWCDNTTELRAARLRPGNAGANTTADHLDVLAAAITQIPRRHRKNLLIRTDGAGASHGLLDWLTEQNRLRGRHVEYSIGFALTETLRQGIVLMASPRYRVHPVSESGWFDPFSVDAAGYRGVGAPAGCRVLGWGSVAQC